MSTNERNNDRNVKVKCQSHSIRYLETSLIDVDIEPNYVRVTVKEKIFQMALNEEVRISDATSKRSQTTGDLLITMPKLDFDGSSIKAFEIDTNTNKSSELHYVTW